MIKPNGIPSESAVGTPTVTVGATADVSLEDRVARMEKLCEERVEQASRGLEQRLDTEVQKIRHDIDRLRQQLGDNAEEQQRATVEEMRIRCRWLVTIVIGTAMIIAGTWL